jgi:anthraniloyl-CoA monooxygenase
MKKAWPRRLITEPTGRRYLRFQEISDDTFETYDRESYRAIVGHFAYWDDIEIHFRGTVHRIGGNGFCGCSRATLLKILGRRARSLGVDVRYQTEVSPQDPAILDADLVVAADGINSRFRETFSDQFQPARPNSWMINRRRRVHGETEHAFSSRTSYEPRCSTWIIDGSADSRAGPVRSKQRFVEDLFAPELKGHRITNRSIWRN